MWVTAFLGMATKYSKVTLAQRYRVVEEKVDGHKMGGRGRGRPDVLHREGLVTAAVVAGVILGGIKRIGKVTAVLAPLMAAVYVFGALTIIALNLDQLIPSLVLIFTEAFNPTAGVAGMGAGVFVVTLMWGVRRGLFSNEAGQGSAPIAHAAAKTDEPVSEGVVALLEPLIDTIIICSMTGLVIIMTNAHIDRFPCRLPASGSGGRVCRRGVWHALHLTVRRRGRERRTPHHAGVPASVGAPG